jgi:hypothetical protein
MRIACLTLVVVCFSIFSTTGIAQTNRESVPAWFDPQIQEASLQSYEYEYHKTPTELAACCSESTDFESILRRLEMLENRDEVFTSRCGWYATSGFRYTQPRSVHLPVHIAGAPNTAIYDFDFDSSISPFGAIEWVRDDGFGLRGSFWYSKNDARAVPENPADAPFGLTMTTYVWDAELTQDVDFDFASLVFTGGLRYLNTTRESDRPAMIQIRTPEITGYGPTVSGEFRRRLDHLTVFNSFRATLLYGDHEHVFTLPGGATGRTSTPGYLAVGDIEVGLEFPRALGLPLNIRTSCFGTVFRDVAYLGLQTHASLNW